ncbi:MAG: SRPBCC family protein [Planctomycetes bacterium]|nr:SRPBCC family protein [Planctomycetota bacterium]
MSLTVCPTCIANAPIEAAWSLLDPAHFDEWWDARTRRVTPEGPLAPGQRIEVSAGPLGLFTIPIDVLEVDPEAHRVRFMVHLPFGISNDQTTVLKAFGPDQCRISFG